uniref:Peptidase S8/S53 domain-containing protein n=1 Tax=Bionectria ochroleuca TaxID=29856 RepID=A0A8H7N3M9_BIOOC
MPNALCKLPHHCLLPLMQKFPFIPTLGDEEEWQLLMLIQPLFALELPWGFIATKSLSDAEAAAEAADFVSTIGLFKSDVRALPGCLPKSFLSATEFGNCRKDLRNLLTFFDGLVDNNVSMIDEVGELLPPSEGAPSTWGAGLYQNVSHVITWMNPKSKDAGVWAFLTQPFTAIAQIVTRKVDQTTGNVRVPDATSEAPEYRNLDDLAEWVQKHKLHTESWAQGHQHREVIAECQAFLTLKHPITKFQKGAAILRSAMRKLKSPSLNKSLSPKREIATTNWKHPKPRQLSHQLYCLLQKRTCHFNGAHKAKLQLDGFLLDNLNEELRLDVFLSSCPPPCDKVWLPGQYTSAKENSMNLDHDELDLCRLFGQHHRHTDEGIPILSLLFLEDYMILEPGSLDPPPSAFQPSSPTMSLASVLESGLLGDPYVNGQFTDGDKAMLALSLGRCLLHLFSGAWMQEVWTSESIHFLCQSDEHEYRIFDIHHPFVTCSLAKPSHAEPIKLTPTTCEPFIRNFAIILLEIETGTKLDIQNPYSPKFQAMMGEHLQGLWNSPRGAKKPSYIGAILGCIDFAEALQKVNDNSMTRLRQNKKKNHADSICSLEDVRNIIHLRVVKKLESHYSEFPDTIEVFAGGYLRFPTSTGTTTKKPQSNPTVYGSKTPHYDFNCHDMRLGNGDLIGYANAFSRDFEQFHRRFIRPLMSKGDKKIQRVKIALLDTGIYTGHSDLQALRQRVMQYRKSQGFEQKEDQDPIKLKESRPFIGDRIRDTIGHGTHVACLLLKFAPDADIYIAKITTTMEFADHEPVKKAIEWATETVAADIVTMSFGTARPSKMVEEAISTAQSKRTSQGHKPIFFASASNHGLRRPKRSFPGSDSNVICGFALDGNGGDNYSLNPEYEEGKDHFGTLGVGISVMWESLKRAYKKPALRQGHHMQRQSLQQLRLIT